MKQYPNLRHLVFLVALAEHRHFRKAAEACNVSQSTLSAGIAEIEALLGVRVAERTRRSVMITQTGRRIVERAIRLLDEADAFVALGEAESDPLSGRLELGCIPSIGPFVLPRFLPYARTRLPDLVFGLREDKTPALLERLQDGRLDLVLMAFPYDVGGLEARMLFDDPFVFACPAGHPLAGCRTIDDADLAGEGLMFMEKENCLHRQVLPAINALPTLSDTAYSATSLHMLAAMVAEGLGSTLLPELAVSAGLLAEHKVTTRPLSNPGNHRTIGLVWRAQSTRVRGFEVIADLFRDWWRGRST